MSYARDDMFMKIKIICLLMPVFTLSHNTALVMPSYPPHLQHLCRFVESMLRFCPSCVAAPLHVVVTEGTREMFEKELMQFRDRVSIRVVALQTIAPFYFASVDETELNKHLPGRFVLQSLKKMYGCLNAGTARCWILDSESFFVRDAVFHDLVDGWFLAPYIIGNQRSNRRGESPQRITVDILGLNSTPPWFLESYLWMWERPILQELVLILESARPSLASFHDPTFFGVTRARHAFYRLTFRRRLS
jgi:hypothetical protein